jgi:cell division protein FtsB
MTLARIIGVLVVIGGVVFGALGGEYSTRNWWTLRKQVSDEKTAIGRLRVEVDSLGIVAQALETDPQVQEKVARESFGMLRPGEIEYRVETAKP